MTAISPPAFPRRIPAARAPRRLGRERATYTRVPIDALFAAAPPHDGGRAQARIDRQAGAMALLLMAATVVVVMLVVVLAVTQLIDVAVADMG